MFNFFKKKNNVIDYNIINRDNVNFYIQKGDLQIAHLISPEFGGSEGPGNQIVVTPKAFREKKMIDGEIRTFLESGRAVKNFECNLRYKGNSLVPSQIIITAIVDGNPYNKIIEVW